MKTLLLIAMLLPTAVLVRGDVEPECELARGSEGTWEISWWGTSGHTYFLQNSDNLVDWFYFPRIETGHDEELEWGFFSDSPELFVRIQYTDHDYENPELDDYDEDSIANWIEVELMNTDPVDPQNPHDELDTDGNGVPDHLEYLMYGGLKIVGETSDFDGDGIYDMAEIGASSPVLADTDGEGIMDGEGSGVGASDASQVSALVVVTPLE